MKIELHMIQGLHLRGRSPSPHLQSVHQAGDPQGISR